MDLFDIVEQIKEHGTLVRPPIRVRKVKKGIQFKGLKSQYTPEQYAKKMERDKKTWAGVSGAWKHLDKTYRSRAKKRGEQSRWKISLEEWWLLWRKAGVDGRTGSTLFSRRGIHKDEAKVYRIDPEGVWELSNMVVVYKGEVVANGRKVSKTQDEQAV